MKIHLLSICFNLGDIAFTMSHHVKNYLRIVSPPDSAILGFVDDLFCAKLLSKASFELFLGVSRRVTDARDFQDFKGKFGESNQGRIRSFQINTIDGVVLSFDKIVTGFDDGAATKNLSLFEAEFYLVEDKQEQSSTQHRELLLEKIWKYFDASAAVHFSAPSQTEAALATHINALSQKVRDIVDLQAQAELDRQTAIEKERETLRLAAETDAAIRKAAHEKQAEALEQKRKELEARASELDDRSAKHARRQLRKELANYVKKRRDEPPISRVSRKHRANFSIIVVFGMLVALISSIHAVLILQKGAAISSPTFYVDAFRLLASSGIFVALLFYILNFWKRVAAEDIEFERRMERFGLDIDRASWTIETVMELSAEAKNTSVPDEWLRGVTANLFETASQSEEPDPTALEALGALLRSGVKLKAGAGGVDVEIDSKSARTIGRS